MRLRKSRESRSCPCPAKTGKRRPIRPKGKTAARRARRARNLIRVVISLWFRASNGPGRHTIVLRLFWREGGERGGGETAVSLNQWSLKPIYACDVWSVKPVVAPIAVSFGYCRTHVTLNAREFKGNSTGFLHLLHLSTSNHGRLEKSLVTFARWGFPVFNVRLKNCLERNKTSISLYTCVCLLIWKDICYAY